MGRKTWDSWRRWLLMSMLGAVVTASGGVTYAQATPATVRLTLVVRDAAGQPLRTTRVDVYLPQPSAPPRGVAHVLTDDRGRVTLERLEPSATYVVQFHGGASIIVAGQDRGFVPIQAVADQNAGRELLAPDDVPGFPIHLGDERDVTVRFVIGGTFSSGTRVAAVPMIDLAVGDDAPVRPINPLTGAELTPEQARTFHAVIGQPWGMTHAAATATSVLDGRPAGAADAAGGTPPLSRVPAGGPAGRLVVVLTLVVGVLATAVVVLLVRQRGRA
ncbi:MAG: hypothetical protein M3R24_25230 [Chloroflexota bacterium]|nr:hypothetical protein [Chloroflexota bacterium]